MAYLLYGITLIAIVSAAYAHLRNSEDQSQYIEESVNTLLAQVEVLKTKLFLCASIYPDGDNGIDSELHAYPAPSTSGNRDQVSNVTCPGAPAGANGLAFMGDGLPMPVPPPDFKPWEYEHKATGGVLLHLLPAFANGAPQIRERLLRRLGTNAQATGDDIAILVLQHQ